jgi:hypothetical protein
MRKNEKSNFQSLYSKKYQYGAFATDTSSTRRDKDARRGISVKGIVAAVLIVVMFVGGFNYLLTVQRGIVFVAFDQSKACGENFSYKTSRSLGFNVYEFEGVGVDYTEILPWGSKPELPYCISEEELTAVEEALAQKLHLRTDYGASEEYLTVETVVGIHGYYCRQVSEGLNEICAIAAVGGYTEYNGDTYLLNGETLPVVIQYWKDGEKIRIHYLSIPYTSNSFYGHEYRLYDFEKHLPDEIYFDLDDADDGKTARSKRDASAEALFNAPVTIDSLEVTKNGRLKIYHPDLENYNPEVDSNLKYELIEDVWLEKP